jgi:hypothetical protein
MGHRAKMTLAARRLRQNLSVDIGVTGPLQWGTIASVSTGTPSTVGVYLDSASGQPGAAITTGIPFLNGYDPTVGDVVLIMRMSGAARTQRIVLGTLEAGLNGQTSGGVFKGTNYTASGVAGLQNAVAGDWIGRWSTVGAPTFVSYTPVAGDWGLDGNKSIWVYDGSEWVASSLARGTSFPASPQTNEHFYRTDSELEFYYDGTRWLTAQIFTCTLASNFATTVNTSYAQAIPALPTGCTDIYVVDHVVESFVGATNNGLNFWSNKLTKYNSVNTGTDIDTAISTPGDTASTWTQHISHLNALLLSGTTYFDWNEQWTKTGSPSQINPNSYATYRFVAT